MANRDNSRQAYGKLLQYIDDGHKYVFDGVERKGRSVTTLMNQVLAKQGLSLWPMDVALELLRNKHPNITLEDFELAAQRHVELRNKGGDTGTKVHAIIEEMLAGKPITAMADPEIDKAMAAFLDWSNTVNPKMLATEQMVASIAGDFYGTFDGIFEINGRLVLVDFKTTNASREAPDGIYAENFIQLGAYLAAYREESAEHSYDIDELMVVSIKKDGQWAVKRSEDVGLTPDECIFLWINTLTLANNLKKMKSLLKPKKEKVKEKKNAS